MNIKKAIAVTLSAATFALSLTACGGKSGTTSANAASTGAAAANTSSWAWWAASMKTCGNRHRTA